LLFLATPFIEIALFIEAGRQLGVLPTIGLTILSTIVGLAIVQKQGLSNLMKMQSALSREEMPIAQIIHAMFLALAGLLLIIPGFFTDFLGLLLLIPPIRAFVGRRILTNMRMTMHSGSGTSFHAGDTGNFHSASQDDVVEAEFWEVSGDKATGQNPRLPPKIQGLPPKAND
jgi:UPF0716 protein FxsA